MRQLRSNWVEYSVIPCLFHFFLCFTVPLPPSGRQRAKQRLKVRKNPSILLHTAWIQPLLLWIRFQTTEALKNGSEGRSEEGWKKKCFAKCQHWRIFCLFHFITFPWPSCCWCWSLRRVTMKASLLHAPLAIPCTSPSMCAHQHTPHSTLQAFPSALLDLAFCCCLWQNPVNWVFTELDSVVDADY